MSASLVGSEMCIRDSSYARGRWHGGNPRPAPSCRRGLRGSTPRPRPPVSYTHLTLPTICSV
eukprot:11378104-Alexandrium_andersonii.AAC.1